MLAWSVYEGTVSSLISAAVAAPGDAMTDAIKENETISKSARLVMFFIPAPL
jgi:hypothetical protein